MKIRIIIESIKRVKHKKEVWNSDTKVYDQVFEVIENNEEVYSQTISQSTLEEKGGKLFDVIKAFNVEK